METLYQVYVLQNAEGKFYVGLSENPIARLEQHNTGVSNWTRNRGQWDIVWKSNHLSLSEARKLENHLKRQKGGQGFYKAIGLQRSSVS